MYRIYTKEQKSKEVFNVNLEANEVQTVMGGNLFLDHPELNPQDYIITQEERAFEHPIYHAETDTIEEMTKYEKYQNGLYELQFNEVIYKDDVLVLQAGQYIDESGVLQTVPKIDGTRVEWNWETHVWEEKATDLEIVEAQYRDYEGMDKPSVLKEMEMQDPALATELINMLIELRNMIYVLQAQATTFRTKLALPKPSEKLLSFKNKFNKI